MGRCGPTSSCDGLSPANFGRSALRSTGVVGGAQPGVERGCIGKMGDS